jgi:hypothetical protein
VYDPELMMVRVRFAAGAVGSFIDAHKDFVAN